MGRRKERRLAAMSAAGRRVKLDLFAEPSGDLGGSSTQDEVGGESDSKNRAGLPNSPSSSGQQTQNPLLLLGQYSDDELDEGSKEAGDSDDADNPSGDAEEQAKVDTGEGMHVNGGDNSVLEKVEQFILEMDSVTPDPEEKFVEDGSVLKKAKDSGYSHGDMDLTGQTASASSDKQAIADVSLGWRMVLHEESNQYYYWNVATGETSWEIPDMLAQARDSAFENKAAGDSGEQEDATASISRDTVGVKVDNSTSLRPNDESSTASQNCITIDNDGHGLELKALKEGSKNVALDDKKEGDDIDQSKLQDSSVAVVKQHCITPLPEDYVSFRPSGDAVDGNGNASIQDSVICKVDMRQQGEHEAATEFSSRLMRHCEYLLEQLKCMNRSKDELLLNCIVEVETRMNDIRSLASYGSALLPFWVHSDKQLKHLEATINIVTSQHHKDEKMSKNEDADKPNGSTGDDIKVNLSEERLSSPPNGDSHDLMLAGTEVQKDSCCRAYDVGTLASEQVSTIGVHTITAAAASDAGGTDEVDGLASKHDIIPESVPPSGEDADMDVDMEVEDSIPPVASDSHVCLPAEHQNLQNLHRYQGSSVSEHMSGIPPPPDEDWMPPPPPDNEPYPPPPPDEPPETPHPPPPGPEPVQTFSYTDQYSQSYPGSNFDYYGQTHTEVPSTNFYAYSEGSQVAVSQSSTYYEAVPTMYSAPVMVNPIEPVAYYAFQDRYPTSVGGGIESSAVGTVSGHKSYNPDPMRSLNAQSEADSVVRPKTKDNGPVVGGEMEKASLELLPSQAPVATSVAENVSVPSTLGTTTSAADAATTSKGQSKVTRTKKRTVAVVSSLRSNKKVSSLVDKWKAAKEELHEEEEEEPETYLEKLEKKRQREIEEWRAQQIASGEAKDNANFQPLGGDWRERVKRKRAQLMNEREQSPTNDVTEGTQQPDLNELSNGLPSGWQVYWDDSSKQVYYGNVLTSETSWTRPTT